MDFYFLKLRKKDFYGQGNKSLRGIPWYSEAMKDAVTGETLRGAGNKRRSGDVRMRKLEKTIF